MLISSCDDALVGPHTKSVGAPLQYFGIALPLLLGRSRASRRWSHLLRTPWQTCGVYESQRQHVEERLYMEVGAKSVRLPLRKSSRIIAD